MKKAVIIGATGFGGLGLIEILLRHPEMQINQLVARKDTGKKISEVFPHLTGFCDLMIHDTEDIDFNDIDIAFFSTPDRAGMTLINAFYKKNIPVIDFSGDFRFKSVDDYAVYARNKGIDDKHLAPEVLADVVYGLPELNADKIASAKIVGNPGCFAINMILALLPAVTEGIIASETIICDGKTGVSGAGKNPGEANFYPQRHEDMNSYREGKHQHLVEVENIINSVGRSEKKILFVPQVVPINRGILTTTYADLSRPLNSDQVMSLYRDYYKNKPFVLISDISPHSAEVRGSNLCKIKPMVDKRTGKLVIISVIDNLIKGQSGNAVQNMNIMFGFDETTGIGIPPFYP